MNTDTLPTHITTDGLFYRQGLYALTEEAGQIVAMGDDSFCPHAYSRFKYGSQAEAENFGLALARLLLETGGLHGLQGDGPMVLTASAYKYLPTAAQAVVPTIQQQLAQAGREVELGRIHRAKVTDGDYALLGHAQRELTMRTTGNSIDFDRFNGRHVLVVDDIRITGSHEDSIRRLFHDLPILSLTHLYIAQMDVEAVRRDPTVESRLNQVSVSNLSDVAALIKDDPGYVFNARTAKFVLTALAEEMVSFLDALGDELLHQLFCGIAGDGCATLKTCKQGVHLLREIAAHRGLAAPW